MNSKLNLISGTRPTGSLHLGHYLGVLRNWVELQNTEKYNCFFFIADWHSLTTKYSDTNEIQKNTIEVAKDFLASGLDPTKSTIYVQSAIPEIAELHLLLSMITPNNWVERDPTLKDLVRAFNGNKIKEETEIENNTNNQLTYGMLGYPILQTSDILSFQGSLVPVGKDQVAHLEMSRDIARKFNSLYQVELFPEPKPLLTKTPVVLGVDGDKMSKSYNNDIKLAASEEETFKMVKQMVTDAERIKKTDPGNTERCLVPYPYYKIFADTETQKLVKEECEGAQIGCFDCKKRLSGLINDYFADIRTKRKGLNDEEVISILKEGNARAKEKASKVLDQAYKATKLTRWGSK